MTLSDLVSGPLVSSIVIGFPSPSGNPLTVPSYIHMHPDLWISACPTHSGLMLSSPKTGKVPHPINILFARRYCDLFINALTCSFCLLQENVNLMRAEIRDVLLPTLSRLSSLSPRMCVAPGGLCKCNEALTSWRGWRGVPAACWCCPLVALSPHRTWLFNLPSTYRQPPGLISVEL